VAESFPEPCHWWQGRNAHPIESAALSADDGYRFAACGESAGDSTASSREAAVLAIVASEVRLHDGRVIEHNMHNLT
jgi:hypothetical protein